MDDKRQDSPSPAHQTIGEAARLAFRTIPAGELITDVDLSWDRAALAAVKHALAQLREHGYRLVPVQITPEMSKAAARATDGFEFDWTAAAMAAPEPDLEALLKEQK